MKTQHRVGWWSAAIAVLGLSSPLAKAAVSMQGDVTLDYYVADVDSEGFESTEAELYVERVQNDGNAASGPLSLSGWLTTRPSATGDGTEVGYAPIGSIPGQSSLVSADEIARAEDAAPGEYYPHMLLQNDDFPGTFEDARDLTPRLLWRGGLEATGPLYVTPYAGGRDVFVDFGSLRNNRIDSRYTNDVVLTLYATYGFGPASDGHVLCEKVVPGLYAGTVDQSPDFNCTIQGVPDGDYTLHLMVAENGGRGGRSTLSGPDVTLFDGRLDDGYSYYIDGTLYLTGSTEGSTLLVLAGLLLVRTRRAAPAVPPGASVILERGL